MALVAGEAGIGRTSVLRALAGVHEPVWWGACDALQTPHPLAPLFDIARESGPRPALFEAVLDELRLAPTPVLMVIEDAHWADDATLDLLKFLGRRIEGTKALLAVRFRDVEEARRAGYSQFLDCVAQPGQGAMGIHYLHSTYPGDALLDPLRPEALMYEPGKEGKLQFVGVGYIVFQEAWDAAHPQPPAMFGHPFHLVRAPNRYGVPAFYELHLWIWTHNGNGIFNDWNPAVRCP